MRKQACTLVGARRPNRVQLARIKCLTHGVGCAGDSRGTLTSLRCACQLLDSQRRNRRSAGKLRTLLAAAHFGATRTIPVCLTSPHSQTASMHNRSSSHTNVVATSGALLRQQHPGCYSNHAIAVAGAGLCHSQLLRATCSSKECAPSAAQSARCYRRFLDKANPRTPNVNAT